VRRSPATKAATSCRVRATFGSRTSCKEHHSSSRRPADLALPCADLPGRRRRGAQPADRSRPRRVVPTGTVTSPYRPGRPGGFTASSTAASGRRRTALVSDAAHARAPNSARGVWYAERLALAVFMEGSSTGAHSRSALRPGKAVRPLTDHCRSGPTLRCRLPA
jgi:hypothetical protein